MGKFGIKNFSVFGRLIEKPQLENTNSNVEMCKFLLEVVERGDKDKGDTTSIVSITAFSINAKSMSQYGKVGSEYYVIGTIRSNEHNGKYYTELVAGRIFGGPDFGSSQDTGGQSNNSQRRTSNNNTRRR